MLKICVTMFYFIFHMRICDILCRHILLYRVINCYLLTGAYPQSIEVTVDVDEGEVTEQPTYKRI